MQFTSEQRLDDGVLEREFTLGEIPGILWTPASTSAPAPLILLGHPPLGLRKMYPRLAARARYSAAEGFATATIELPGSGDRPRWPAVEQARADLRRAMQTGEPVSDEVGDEGSTRRGDKEGKEGEEGRPPWTPSFRCPRSAARSGTRAE
ncbi:hypothetical protein OK006_10588 [Actinobacteria bacterium OK006]|nr:hypothetical protein OK006_10588 [Actinobacteria bacterium OK006]